MYIALNKNKNRIHIDDANDTEKYYCQSCGEELVLKNKGTINAHHFAHRSNSYCNNIDGWHYDMTEWHYDWQSQFPISCQEVVFNKNGRSHRADIFINKTIIEFQHSPLSEVEFYDRNEFYNSLGYKVIWIFDGSDDEIDFTDNYSKYGDELLSWKGRFRFLNYFDYKNKMVDIYVQCSESIWTRQMDYRKKEYWDELDERDNLIKIDWVNPQKGLRQLITKNQCSDVCFLSNYIDLHFKQKVEAKEVTIKEEFSITDISDSVNASIDYPTRDFLGYCPYKEGLVNHSECHNCQFLDINTCRCIYRFNELLNCNITKVNMIQYDKNDRVKELKIIIDGEEKTIHYDNIPYYTNSLLYYANNLKNIGVARFFNTKSSSEYCIQMSNYNLNQLIKTGKCFGRLCKEGFKCIGGDREIYNWDKESWILTWYIEKD